MPIAPHAASRWAVEDVRAVTGGRAVVDADVHVAPAGVEELLPHLSDHWRDQMTERGVATLDPNLYPSRLRFAAPPESRPEAGAVGSSLELLRAQLLEPWNVRAAVLQPDVAVDAMRNPDWARALAGAVNDWQRERWLARDARLRGSVVVPAEDVDGAVAEIDRVAGDRRFVQVTLPVRSIEPYGRRRWWPLYRAACERGLAVAIHAGGLALQPSTAVGWPSSYAEEYVALSAAFSAQLVSLVAEGVFAELPALRVVLAEGGWTWLPPLLWRLDKNWKGIRREVPWVDRPPSEIVAERVRCTLQPLDTPADAAAAATVYRHLESDCVLLFSTDFPHWQFDAPSDALPFGLEDGALDRLLSGNAADVYPRLGEMSESE